MPSTKYDKKLSVETFFPITASVLDTGDAFEVGTSSRIFEKLINFASRKFRGMEEDDP